ncbi:MAG TPA: hypothetical protein VJV79_09725 [Polyangiaceae bacterium]|nr:hypothetical protein [Polyangiaceae bacterium]
MSTEVLQGSSWTPDALEVVKRACDYYGGVEAWRSLRRIRLIPDRLSGLLPRLKGVGYSFRLPTAFEIAPHERWIRFIGYPDQDHDGVFDNGVVRLERRGTREVVAIAENHRQSFCGLAKYRRWSPLDALYFFGYALTHYHALPFTLLDGRLIATASTGARANAMSALEIELPEDLPTHCRRQRFYFDRDGRLVRHDYHSEIVGIWARGAHFWNRQTRFGGFPISLERYVVARFGSITVPIPALHATFLDAEVEFAS